MSKNKLDIISAACFFIYGLALTIGSLNMNTNTTGAMGPSFFPRIVGIGIIIVSILLVLHINTQRRTGTKGTGEGVEVSSDRKCLIYSMILLVIYVALLESIGFIIMSTIFMFGEMCILAPTKNDKRQIAVFLVIAVVSAVLVDRVFVEVFSLMLPDGLMEYILY